MERSLEPELIIKCVTSVSHITAVPSQMAYPEMTSNNPKPTCNVPLLYFAITYVPWPFCSPLIPCDIAMCNSNQHLSMSGRERIFWWPTCSDLVKNANDNDNDTLINLFFHTNCMSLSHSWRSPNPCDHQAIRESIVIHRFPVLFSYYHQCNISWFNCYYHCVYTIACEKI